MRILPEQMKSPLWLAKTGSAVKLPTSVMKCLPLLFAAVVPALLLAVVGCLSERSVTADAAEGKTRIVFIAGKQSHGSGEHEFNAGAIILARALNEQSGLPVHVEVVHDGWPADPAVFDGAAAVVIYSDGLGSHPAGGHWEEVEEMMRRGVGLMLMHFAVHVRPGEEGERFLRWTGGFYEDDFSVNPHWTADTEPHGSHPVGRGVAPVKIHDEWYFNIRFAEPAIHTGLLTATPSYERIRAYNAWHKNAQEALGIPQTLMWGVERPDGGRGVGFTGGHWHYNWAIEDYRRMVLNAIVWVAGLDVPEEGVKSLPLTEADLNANLDAKPSMRHVALPGPHNFDFTPARARVIE